MKVRIVRVVLGCVATAVMFGAPVSVQAGDPAVDEAQMMEMMQKYVMPGDQHQAMSNLVGHWDYTSRFWMMPDAEPQTSTGTSEYSWMHEGRYMFQSVDGMAMGMPFTGTSITGYDRFNEEYFTFWIDNMSTGFMVHRGPADESGKVITMEGTVDDPWTGEKGKWSKMVATTKNDDAHSLAMFVKGPDGSEYKMFEIDYTRSEMASR